MANGRCPKRGLRRSPGDDISSRRRSVVVVTPRIESQPPDLRAQGGGLDAEKLGRPAGAADAAACGPECLFYHSATQRSPELWSDFRHSFPGSMGLRGSPVDCCNSGWFAGQGGLICKWCRRWDSITARNSGPWLGPRGGWGEAAQSHPLVPTGHDGRRPSVTLAMRCRRWDSNPHAFTGKGF